MQVTFHAQFHAVYRNRSRASAAPVARVLQSKRAFSVVVAAIVGIIGQSSCRRRPDRCRRRHHHHCLSPQSSLVVCVYMRACVCVHVYVLTNSLILASPGYDFA